MPSASKLFATMTILGATMASPPPAGADSETHCVVAVVGRGADGSFVTGPESCYPSFSEAMASVDGDSGDGSLGTTSFAIGVHYDGFSGSGSSLTVTGDSCTGGWLNLSSTWVNRISSTRNGCNRITHFDGYNLSGSTESTFTAGSTTNLSSLNNATNSIQYLS